MTFQRCEATLQKIGDAIVPLVAALGFAAAGIVLNGDAAVAGVKTGPVSTTATVKADCRVTSPSSQGQQGSLLAIATERPGRLPWISLTEFNPVQVACTKGTSALLTIPSATSKLTVAGSTDTLNIVSWVSSSSNSGVSRTIPAAGQFAEQQRVSSCPSVPAVTAVTSLGDAVPLSFGVAACMPAFQMSAGGTYQGNVGVVVVF